MKAKKGEVKTNGYQIILILIACACGFGAYYLLAGSSSISGLFVGNLSAGIEIPVQVVISEGVGMAEKPACNVSPEEKFISLELLQGQSKSERVSIKNLCGKTNVTAVQEGLEQFLSIKETKFSMERNEEKSVLLNFYVNESAIAGIYRGRVIIKGGGFEKIVYIILQVTEKAPLFDIIVNIWPDYEVIKQGGVVRANITLRNIGMKDDVRTALNVGVEQINGTRVFDAPEEIFIVEKEFPTKTLTREWQLPSEVAPGRYFLVARAGYENVSAEAYDIFEVAGGIKTVVYAVTVGIIIGGIIVGGLVYLVLKGLLKGLLRKYFGGKGKKKVAVFA